MGDTVRRLAIAVVPLLAVNFASSEASANELVTVAATAAGVVIGGIAATAVAAGTTATLVGAAIGGGIACWWYERDDASNIEALPRKSALRKSPAGGLSPGAMLIGDSGLRVVMSKR